jgi:hypothetical protein
MNAIKFGTGTLALSLSCTALGAGLCAPVLDAAGSFACNDQNVCLSDAELRALTGRSLDYEGQTRAGSGPVTVHLRTSAIAQVRLSWASTAEGPWEILRDGKIAVKVGYGWPDISIQLYRRGAQLCNRSLTLGEDKPRYVPVTLN